jgi:predicted nucleotidyltransferase
VLLDYSSVASARERFEERLRLRGELSSAARAAMLDLVILNDAPPTFATRIVTAGKRMYCRDAEADHSFRRDAQLRAADLAPFLRRTSEIKRQALAR